MTSPPPSSHRSTQYFSIDAGSGMLFNVMPLDRERAAEYQLTVVAQDNGYPHQKALVAVTVVITDVNDHVPRFERQAYDVTVAERAPPSPILQLQVIVVVVVVDVVVVIVDVVSFGDGAQNNYV